MIVRMSKVEIVGAKDLLQETLALLRELGIFQIEPASSRIHRSGGKTISGPSCPMRRACSNGFSSKTSGRRSTSCSPSFPSSRSGKLPRAPRPSSTHRKDHRTAHRPAKELFEKRDALQQEQAELDRYGIFLGTLASLVEKFKGNARPRFHRPDHPRAGDGRPSARGHLAHHGLEVRALTRRRPRTARWSASLPWKRTCPTK